MLRRKSAVALSTVVLALSLPLGTISLHAESACKDLDSADCKKKDNCVWVDSYARKDGVKVKAYCKSKPKMSGKSGEKKSGSTKKSESMTKTESKK